MMIPRNLNIAMLSIHSCPIGELGTKDTGGMSVYIRGLAKELGKKGNRVDIFTRRHDDRHAAVMELSDNVRLIHLKVENDDDLSKLAVYPRIKDYAAALDRFKQNEVTAYNLIHSHYWLSGLVGDRLRLLWGVPHMVMFHTLGVIKNSLTVGEKEPDYRISSEKGLVLSCQKVVAPTEREKEDTIKYYNASSETVAVIPCGVDKELFKRVSPDAARRKLGIGLDDKVVLYVGRVEPLKGVNRIVESLAYLKGKMTVKFIIVGGDDPETVQMQHIKGLVQKRGLEDQVVWAGRVDQQNLPLFYSAADALVVASFYESFGLVALEALSCGTPVVSTAVGGMSSIIRNGKTGVLVHDDSVESMGGAIFDVLSNSGIYQKQAKVIRGATDGLSWPMVANKTMEAYRSLLN